VKYLSLIGAGVGVLFTPVAVILSLKSAQQGDFYWAGVFYPLLTVALLKGSGPVVAILALLQYPLFGWYTGRCIAREQYIRLATIWSVLQIIPMVMGLMN
jgi:hypothetical protein